MLRSSATIAASALPWKRDRSSNYRLYDRTQLARLRMVKVLRDAGYGFAAIRVTLDEMGSGRPEAALSAIERRRRELTGASERCARATAAFWGYVAEVHGKPGPLSGSLRRAAEDG
jgi:DNA-binding transcriptional MerR regulator